MIEALLQTQKITPEQFDMYMLFQVNELGRKVLDRMTHAYFMDEPAEKEFSGAGFAFYDGRRSVFRDIHRSILFVQDQARKLANDNPS
jgi:hypothetical protein